MKVKTVTEKEIALFEQKLIKAEKSASTIKKYVRDVKKLQKFAEGNELTHAVMLAYKKQLETKGTYKASSINSFLTAVNRFCIIMNRNDLCVRTIKVQRAAFETEEKELTMQEYRQLVHAAIRQGEEVTALLLQTIAGTGIRVGELQYIDVKCLESGVADVYNKGKVRRILLPSALQTILREFVQKEQIREGAVFQNRNKQPMDRREVWRRMKNAAVAADIPQSKVFPHNLRHLFARQFYQQTGDIVKLADVLGHSNIDTTRIYVKSTGREHKKQLDQMQMVLESGHGERRDYMGDCSKAGDCSEARDNLEARDCSKVKDCFKTRDCSKAYDTGMDNRKHVSKFGSCSDSGIFVSEMGKVPKVPALVEYLMLSPMPAVSFPEMFQRQRSDLIDPFICVAKNNRHYGDGQELLHWYILEQRYRHELCIELMCNKKRCHLYE